MGWDRTNGKARSILVDSGGIVSVADSVLTTAQDLTNTLSANTLGSANNLMDGLSCLLAGTESSVVDFGSNTAPSKICILANSSTTATGNGIDLLLSVDNSNWAKWYLPLSLSNTDAGSNTINASMSQTIEIAKVRYLKIKVFALGTFDCSVVGVN